MRITDFKFKIIPVNSCGMNNANLSNFIFLDKNLVAIFYEEFRCITIGISCAILFIFMFFF